MSNKQWIAIWPDRWKKPAGWWTTVSDDGILTDGTPIEDMAPYYLGDKEQTVEEMRDTFFKIFDAVYEGGGPTQGSLSDLLGGTKE